MRKHAAFVAKWLWRHLVGQRASQRLIGAVARLAGVDLLVYAYKQIGILKCEDFHATGERHVVRDVLKQRLRKPDPIFFDVGANLGNYSAELRSHFPGAQLYAIEPNPHTFKTLSARLQSAKDHCFCVAFGDAVESRPIYTYDRELNSSHSSILKEVFLDIHRNKNISSFDIHLTRLDDFCEANQIERIDFLKIDTEGYELNVLKGAERMLRENRIAMIQFEFNSMLVCSRVFLRDFYALLGQYEFFRMDSNRLIPLAEYDARNEIFQFQNIFCCQREIDRYR